jgi:7,8-dihydro-6-hydroxymethylpterin dimethyltransferase
VLGAPAADRPRAGQPFKARPAVRPAMGRSLCPECFAEIPAAYREAGGRIYQEKTCKEHGDFRSLYWHDAGHFAWTNAMAGPKADEAGMVAGGACGLDGCGPSGCGPELAPDARRCLAVVDVTQNCNLACAYCFASSRPGLGEPPRAHVEALLRTVRNQAGVVPIQLSGGEPTTRADLPEIVAFARGLGFHHIEVNTNGIHLGRRGYAEELRAAGVSAIYLQFDGFGAHEQLRGAPLDAAKGAAISACRRAGLPVILVPTVVAGINDHQLGDIVRFALANLDVVRGVNVQPVSHFGRHAQDTGHLHKVARLLAEQTGFLRVRELVQVPCCSPQCSSATMLLATPDGAVPLTRFVSTDAVKELVASFEDARFMDVLAGRADGAEAAKVAAACCGISLPAGMERLLPRTMALTITGFMDADTVDLDRLGQCCIQVPTPGGRMAPFCGWNLTDRSGRYRLRERYGRGLPVLA